MKSLFLRIFVSFWATIALFLVLAILVTIAMRPNRRGVENTGPQILAEAVNAYRNGGEHGAFDYVEELQRTQHVRAFVFDPAGRELSGRIPPPWIEDIRRGLTPRHRSWIENLLPDRFSRQGLTLDGKRYTLVLELAGRRGVFFFGPHEVPVLALAILVISSGLVCSLLAWSLTSPVTRLRKAAQRLAAGDLTARAGAPLRGRGDELAELMRDFDRMAERIEGLVESQSRLLKDVSHELRSPLARLSVALGLAQQKAGSEVAAALERIELEADRLNRLIQRLLTISRLESGTDGIHKVRLSLRELLDQVARDAEYETPGSICKVNADGNAFLVEGDPELLRSAIENVVRNATRYTAAGTAVEIQLEERANETGTEALIRVLDSGPGVPEEALERIFQPFYRVDDARNRQTGGAGLGLSIAERAVRLHGGRVRASNRPEGGLEVEIRIPSIPGFALPAHS